MEQLLYKMVNLTDELLCFVDTNYCYQEVNDAYLRLFRTKKETYIGKSVASVMGEDLFLEIKGYFERCFAGEVVFHEKWFCFSHDVRYYLLVTYTPYVVEHQVLGVIVSMKNYTEQKNKEEERLKRESLLAHHGKMTELGSMASLFNHQWRTPLNVLGSYFLKLKVFANTQETNTSFQATLVRCEELLEQVSDDLNAFEAFYNPNKRTERVDLEEALRHVLALLEGRIQMLDVIVGLRLTKKIEVRCIKNDLLHLLMIFFSNALDAFESRKTIVPMLDIAVRVHNDNVLILIEDNAGGIPKVIFDQLFVNFVSTKAEKENAGMGLYFAKIIAKESLGAQLALRDGKSGLKVVLEIPK